ncbi:ORF-126 [Catopsilia pomona nucleopolyhedrovirus]|uniref:ORF-126 n=1 Tax=Catopsilia pomona nucleopolyhedrovirus TaxID=1850906 RepID=A0A172WZJ8_9ABAC|nr:ORF-126 [Catopsilia pomona nucleopolyhedrovirus]ANF29774.1 ORF-126 [Catopsilia pomona nucleopolyhedrovirus]
MSLAAKLIVYNYYASNYLVPHSVYGEYYQLYRIVREYLYTDGVASTSCIERDIDAAKRLIKCDKNNSGYFDEALKSATIDCGGDSADHLSQWYGTNEIANNVSDSVRVVLQQLNALIPMNVRIGKQIFHLDNFNNDEDVNAAVDSLHIILDQFLHTVRDGKLLRIANVLNATTPGWWYNKFCVMTYVHRVNAGNVPAELTMRLLSAITKFCTDNCDQINSPHCIAELYGKFCGIGKEHFCKHKMSCVHVLFEYLRNGDDNNSGYGRNCLNDKFSCHTIVKDFAKQCRDAYVSLKNEIDSLYINSNSDTDKNVLFDVLCTLDSEEIDMNCYYYVIENFKK